MSYFVKQQLSLWKRQLLLNFISFWEPYLGINGHLIFQKVYFNNLTIYMQFVTRI